jgi:hypothetical protein
MVLSVHLSEGGDFDPQDATIEQRTKSSDTARLALSLAKIKNVVEIKSMQKACDIVTRTRLRVLRSCSQGSGNFQCDRPVRPHGCRFVGRSRLERIPRRQSSGKDKSYPHALVLFSHDSSDSQVQHCGLIGECRSPLEGRSERNSSVASRKYHANLAPYTGGASPDPTMSYEPRIIGSCFWDATLADSTPRRRCGP